jgi:hypothetical protein
MVVDDEVRSDKAAIFCTREIEKTTPFLAFSNRIDVVPRWLLTTRIPQRLALAVASPDNAFDGYSTGRR